MSVRVDHSTYLKTVVEDDKPEGEPEPMSSEFVKSWLKDSGFFDNLVETPEVHEKLAGGVIRVTQTTPWETVRVVTFTPTS